MKVRRMQHYFPNVPGLGNVAISRHAQERAAGDGISDEEFADVLLTGDTVPDGPAVVWRQKGGVRIVIVRRPDPFHGAMLATTAFRIGAQATVRR